MTQQVREQGTHRKQLVQFLDAREGAHARPFLRIAATTTAAAAAAASSAAPSGGILRRAQLVEALLLPLRRAALVTRGRGCLLLRAL